MQSTVEGKDNLHVAIIMDGNGRWATRRGLPRSTGHRAGVAAVRRVAEAAPDLGVTTLTLFAFSSDNWRRPQQEVSTLMSLLRYYLRTESARLIDSGTRLTVIGRRDRLPSGTGNRHGDAARSANCPRLFLARRNRQCSRTLAGGSCSLARGFRSASRCARAEGRRRCRPAHPHRRRKAPVRLPVVGVRLRGTLLRRNPMARFRQRASACRDRRLPWAGTAFRRAPPSACARRRRMIRRRPWWRRRIRLQLWIAGVNRPIIISSSRATRSTAALAIRGFLRTPQSSKPALAKPQFHRRYCDPGVRGRRGKGAQSYRGSAPLCFII